METSMTQEAIKFDIQNEISVPKEFLKWSFRWLPKENKSESAEMSRLEVFSLRMKIPKIEKKIQQDFPKQLILEFSFCWKANKFAESVGNKLQIVLDKVLAD